MSDENKETTATPEQAPAGSAPENQTAGALLRQARERAGMHIGALAVSMRVPLKKLELLENDRYDQLPDPAFVRALASSVCRALKINAEPILARLPQTDAPRLTADGAGMNVPFQRPSDLIGAAWWSQLPKPVIVLVLLLLAGVLTLLFMPDVEQGDVQATATTPATQAAAETALPPAVPVQSTPPSALSMAAPAMPVTAPPAPAAPISPVASVTPPKATTAPVPPAPQAQAVPAKPAEVMARAPGAAPATATVPSAAGGVLVFKTRGTSWVEVTDAQGGVLLRRNLESGETVGVSGNPPLAVVIGRADATEVWLRGKPFPLQGVSSENVARFEVK